MPSQGACQNAQDPTLFASWSSEALGLWRLGDTYPEQRGLLCAPELAGGLEGSKSTGWEAGRGGPPWASCRSSGA